MIGFEIYVIGFVLGVLVFYYGGVRGKASNPEIWSVVFGALWPITVPLLIYMVFKKEKGS